MTEGGKKTQKKDQSFARWLNGYVKEEARGYWTEEGRTLGEDGVRSQDSEQPTGRSVKRTEEKTPVGPLLHRNVRMTLQTLWLPITCHSLSFAP